MRERTAAVLAVLMLVGVAIGAAPVSGASESGTNSMTVVVAVGDSSTTDLTANAIAAEHGYSVIHAPTDGLDVRTTQTLKQRVEHGDLQNAIVLGTGTDSVTQELESNVNLDSVHVIEPDGSDTPARVTYLGALRQWESSSSAFVVANNTTDQRKTSVALDNVSAPVLSAELSKSDIEGVLNSLSVETVHVSPGVSDSLQSGLNESYTVKTSVNGVPLNHSLQRVAGGLANGTDDVMVTTPEHTLAVSQFGVRANSTVLVAEDSSRLGNSTRQNLTGASHVYAANVGLSTVASETTANVTTVQSHFDLRSSLLASKYPYPVVVSDVEESGDDQIDVEMTNIGFASVPEVDNTTLTAKWSGLIRQSDPVGHNSGEFHVIEYNQTLAPGDSVSASLTVERVDNGGHPVLEYYAGADGDFRNKEDTGLIGVDSEIDLGSLDYTAPLYQVILLAIAIAVVLTGAVAWALRRTGSSSERGEMHHGVLGVPIDGDTLLRLFVIVVAIGLMLIPDPFLLIDEFGIGAAAYLIQAAIAS